MARGDKKRKPTNPDSTRPISEKVIAGSTTLRRCYCETCGEYVLVEFSEVVCRECNEPLPLPIDRTRILSGKKRYLSKKEKDAALRNSDGTCYWCNRKLGMFLIRNEKMISLKLNYDHRVPYSYVQNHIFLVVSCHICNAFKSNLMFKTEDECREYLSRKWDKEIRSGRILITDG